MRVEGNGQRDDALATDQILDAGLLGPAVGFVGFEFEFGDGFDGVTGWEDFGVGGVELVGGGGGAGEGRLVSLSKRSETARMTLVRRPS